MLSAFFLKPFRIILFPFSLLYWMVIGIRNRLYDKGILSSTSFGLPLICVGNLSVGGTGKSPMVEFIVASLKERFKVATLSRGYKRKTKGYTLADAFSTALDIGDEPMQFHLKFPDVPVAVGEERIVAIPQLLHDRPETEVIILDDAFQHRSIKAGLNILLTDQYNLFTRDFYLPTGNLRDLKSSYKRAELIVVTKCNPQLSKEEADIIRREIKLQAHQDIFFTTTRYNKPYHILSGQEKIVNGSNEVLIVTGIANPQHLKEMAENRFAGYDFLQYPDHYIFSIDDLLDIKKKYEQMEGSNKIILTTEKDAVRLIKFREEIKEMPLYVLPVQHFFLFEQEEKFKNRLVEFMSAFRK